MKNLFLVTAFLGMTVTSTAQKSQVKAAVNYLNDKKFELAKTAIDAAANEESTKGETRTWYVRSTIYLAMQQDPSGEGKDYYKEAGVSLKKVITIQPDFEKADINNKLFAVAIYNFNDGLTAFKNSNYEKSFNNFGEVVDIHNVDGGKRFATNKELDTVARQSALYQAYSAYYLKNYDVAQPLFEKAKTDPIVASANIYLMLADLYKQKNDLAAQQKVLADGRKAYPQEKSIQNAEINAYIISGKSNELVTKLEDAIKTDAQNPDLLYILGTAYNQMANPKEGDKEMPKPANYTELFTKAETAFKAAITINGDHLDANYNAGALYFNRAVGVNDKMNAIADSKAAADVKKWEGYKKERDEWFSKALPYLEKTIAIYDGKTGSLNGEDKQTYMNAMISAKQCYGSLNKSDKFMEMKKKIEATK